MIGSRNTSKNLDFQMIKSFNKPRVERFFIKAFIKGVIRL
jgi:hypothetical protein